MRARGQAVAANQRYARGGRIHRKHITFVSCFIALWLASLEGVESFFGSLLHPGAGAARSRAPCLFCARLTNSKLQGGNQRRHTPTSKSDGVYGPAFPITFDAQGELFSGTRSILIDPNTQTQLMITYTNDAEVARSWIDSVCYSCNRDHANPCSTIVLGFDTESKPQFVSRKPGALPHGPAVLQLSTCSQCLVVHLPPFTKSKKKELHPLVAALAPILSDASVIKAGVGLDDDALDLWSASRGTLEVRGRFDLGGVGAEPPRTRGLANLTEAFLNVDLKKNKRITMSDWSARPPLSANQVDYAAKDAWAGAAVCAALQLKLKLNLKGEEEEEEPWAVVAGERTLADLNGRQLQRKAARAAFKVVTDELTATHAAYFNANYSRKDSVKSVLAFLKDEQEGLAPAASQGPTAEEKTALKGSQAEMQRALAQTAPDGVHFFSPES
eukprot:829063-Rhodomonas_salina.1